MVHPDEGAEDDGMLLFREFLRVLPGAKIDAYYKFGRWNRESLETDLELVRAHRLEAGAPEPPPLEDIPEPELPYHPVTARPPPPPQKPGARPPPYRKPVGEVAATSVSKRAPLHAPLPPRPIRHERPEIARHVPESRKRPLSRSRSPPIRRHQPPPAPTRAPERTSRAVDPPWSRYPSNSSSSVRKPNPPPPRVPSSSSFARPEAHGSGYGRPSSRPPANSAPPRERRDAPPISRPPPSSAPPRGRQGAPPTSGGKPRPVAPTPPPKMKELKVEKPGDLIGSLLNF